MSYKKDFIKILNEELGNVKHSNDYRESFDKVASIQEDTLLRLEERRSIINMRKGWSLWILIVIIGVVVFDMIFIILLGCGVFEFEGDFTVPFFVGESVFKVIGLAYIVVNFLFNKDSILE